GLQRALAAVAKMRASVGARPPQRLGAFDTRRLDWFDLRNMLLVAESVAAAALAREESRGAHQREDFPEIDPAWDTGQTVALEAGRPVPMRRALAEAAQ
ncbi:MAG: FAD-binding protein, partial [Stellaceae bacterium]